MPVNFYLDNRADKHGDSAIRISVSIRGTRFLSSTPLKIPKEKWDSARRQVKRGASNSAGVTWNNINAAMAKITTRFADLENDYIARCATPTVDELRAAFCLFTGKQDKSTASADSALQRMWMEFVTERGEKNQWTRATYQKFDALRNHIFAWRPNAALADFTEKGLMSFVAYMREKAYMKNTTIGKQLGFLKWFLRWASLKGYKVPDDFKNFSPKLKTAQRRVVFLGWEELMRVMAYEVPPSGTQVELTDFDGCHYQFTVEDASGIEKAREIFCLCCFTSLRYSDAINLRYADISSGSITVTTQKTSDTITIELNKYALEIINRQPRRKDGYIMPRLTNQRMNRYLKDLCELCGINEPVTRTYYRGAERIDETMPKFQAIGTHTGRRTFICNALMLGIPAEIVMKWTGHSDYKSMKPYIDVTSAAKSQAMNRFNDL